MTLLRVWFVVWLLAGSLVSVDGDVSSVCPSRVVHVRRDAREFHFSWRAQPNQTFSWKQGRAYCRRHCMDLVSFDAASDWKTTREAVRSDKVPFVWTSGRKCNFAGCDRRELLPSIENGWFWANTKARIPNPFGINVCSFCAWGPTGGLGKRQPDNRQGLRDNLDEGCLAVLNNLYGDGIRWHDVACSHRKPVVCASGPRLPVPHPPHQQH